MPTTVQKKSKKSSITPGGEKSNGNGTQMHPAKNGEQATKH